MVTEGVYHGLELRLSDVYRNAYQFVIGNDLGKNIACGYSVIFVSFCIVEQDSSCWGNCSWFINHLSLSTFH